MRPIVSLWLLTVCLSCNRTPEPSADRRASVTPVVAAPAEARPSSPDAPDAPDLPGKRPGHGVPGSKLKHVIVIAMENHDALEIYEDPVNAPYIHWLLQRYAHAKNFEDELPREIPSEGHYVWMEAGTHQFSDAVFEDDSPPSGRVSTGSNLHLVRQIKNSSSGLSWMAYQEGMNEESGACPVRGSGFYVPKHNPFIFFRDVAGDPPARDTPYCAAHHKPYSALAADLSGELASYVFITPDECHDMHGQRGCPEENPIRTGDRWLANELPRLIAYADQHDAVIFITFDEGGSTADLPFIAVGKSVKPNYASPVHFNHGSQLKSVERILGLPALATVAKENDFADFFQPGAFP